MSIKTLSKAINHLDEQEARWFAVYTRYKREKWVAQRLADKGIECYVPLQKVTRRYTRKVKHLEIPLISCYIFVKIRKSSYIPVLEEQEIVTFVKIAKDLIAIPEREINLMKRITGEEYAIEAQARTLEVGNRVRIATGNLTGMEGILVQKENKKQFVVELDQLGYQLLLQIPEEQLELI